MFGVYSNGKTGGIVSFFSGMRQRRQDALARRAYEIVERHSRDRPWYCSQDELAHQLGVSEERVLEVLMGHIDAGRVRIEIIGSYKAFTAAPKRNLPQPSV